MIKDYSGHLTHAIIMVNSNDRESYYGLHYAVLLPFRDGNV
jgi:hypothetical protein